MPTNLLQDCRDHLAGLYKTGLGYNVRGQLSQLSESREPVWTIVSLANIAKEAPSGAYESAGVLLDPEIGTIHYLLPFAPKDDIKKQAVRALGLRSKLLKQKTEQDGQSGGDPMGAWRIVIVWLVRHAADIGSWTTQIMSVRRETAFSEELTFDVISISDGKLKLALENYGFPRLLLATRETLKKQSVEEVSRWMTADELVATSLRSFTAAFRLPEQRALAKEIVESMESFQARMSAEVNSPQASAPLDLRHLAVTNFRNLKEFNIDFGDGAVSSRIVHGPNGTGKSSVCEAVAIGLFGSSFRYRLFADRDLEKDVSNSDRGRAYLDEYLVPIDDPTARPKISINGQALAEPPLIPASEVHDKDLAMCGTILTQDASQEFAHFSSGELGARVLRGYSDLAEHIEEFAEAQSAQANAARQDFLRRYNISASVTRIDTAYERIARSELDETTSLFPQLFVQWLDRISTKILGFEAESSVWRTWNSEAIRKDISKAIAKRSDLNRSKREIEGWLEQYNDLCEAAVARVQALKRQFPWMSTGDVDLIPQLRLLGEWAENRQTTSSALPVDASVELASEVERLMLSQRTVTAKGKEVGANLEHLITAKAFVSQLDTVQKDVCPTCGTTHSNEGGLLGIIDARIESLTLERERLREQFAKLKVEIASLQSKLGALGQAQCPLSPDDVEKLASATGELILAPASFIEHLSDPRLRASLILTVETLFAIPSLPEKIDAAILSNEVIQKSEAKFRQAEVVFEGPNNWKPVKEKLTETLAGIVNEHLPNTLVRLWRELAMNLTAAPWLLPERPSISILSKRGAKRSSVQVSGRLARYVLNQSEIHTLGLAWFFTRYLTLGRFAHTSLVLDDPAQEMDQTSFRDLCRLLETWVRLHKVYEKPLKLIVLLNQESRALDAARATNGVLVVLGWTSEQGQPVQLISFDKGGRCSPDPAVLMQKLA